MKSKSVVIRGKVFPGITQKSIDSIRSWFDGELLLSTWEDQCTVSGIDKLIISKDPGAGPVQQAYRQLVSYKAGLDNCKGDEVLVTRSDIVHYRDLFSIFDLSSTQLNDYKIFSKKIVIFNMMSINPSSNHFAAPTPISRAYRLSDWTQVGYKEDLYKWCDAISTFEDYKDSGLCTEQLWFTNLIKRYKDPSFPITDITSRFNDIIPYVVSNFKIIDMITTGKSKNLNWANQPEYLGCYFTEKLYEDCCSVYRVY